MGDRYRMEDEEEAQTGFEGLEAAVDDTQIAMENFGDRLDQSGMGKVPVDMEADLQRQMQGLSGPMAGIERLGWKAEVPSIVPGDIADPPEPSQQLHDLPPENPEVYPVSNTGQIIVGITRDPDTREYKVFWVHGGESQEEPAYYTDDPQDAVDTMLATVSRGREQGRDIVITDTTFTQGLINRHSAPRTGAMTVTKMPKTRGPRATKRAASFTHMR